MPDITKERYFDKYWQKQDRIRVSRRAEWRAMQLYKMIGRRYRSLLDVGAGQGELLFYFQAAGYCVTGWDVSPAAVLKLQCMGFTARQVDIEKDYLEGKYDVIAICEVLQQVREPLQVIRKLKYQMKAEGVIFMSVPNEFHILRRLGFGKPVESHISLFSPRRARQFIKCAEMKVECKCYQPLAPPRWGKFLHGLGKILATIYPSLFCLSSLYLLSEKK